MFGLGHLPEILAVCFIALLVFGPKRVIEMGSQLGKAARELREATKDLNIGSLLLGNDETNSAPRTTSTLGMLSQFTQTFSTPSTAEEQATPAATMATPASAPTGGEPFVESTLTGETTTGNAAVAHEPASASTAGKAWLPGDE